METRPNADWCSLDTGQTGEDVSLHEATGVSIPMPVSPINSSQAIYTYSLALVSMMAQTTTAERVGQGRRTRGNQPALQEGQSRMALTKDFYLWHQCSRRGCPWGLGVVMSETTKALASICSAPKGLNSSPICRRHLMPSSFLYHCSSFLCFYFPAHPSMPLTNLQIKHSAIKQVALTLSETNECKAGTSLR